MVIRTLLKRHAYYDSITLMLLAQEIKKLDGVEDIGAVMATPANLDLLHETHLLPANWLALQDTAPEANDLLIAVRAVDDNHAENALQAAEQHLTARKKERASSTPEKQAARSLEIALRQNTDANLAVVAVAGEHAWLEAEQALRLGLHVFLFSDNVPVEQEQRLKALAIENGLLLMGPDCGTAVINGVGLGFSNVVPRGSVGIIGASGTGMQQVMCLLAAAGVGISQAIGTGGRDLSEEIGGVMMRHSLSLLAYDPQTSVIVLISKPPAPSVVQAILQDAAHVDKPVIIIFLGADTQQFTDSSPNLSFARTLTEGATLAGKVAGGNLERMPQARLSSDDVEKLAKIRSQLAPSQRYLRALYSGGTLCEEAMLLFSERVGPIASNIPLQPAWQLATNETFRGHTALDLGADEFTRGRPHPMIDASLRLHYLNRAADDRETALILLDIVLGFCAHADPASLYAAAIKAARQRAAAAGRILPVIVSLCGTEDDPQCLSRQRQQLEAAGALVYESNVAATLAAIALLVE